VDEGATRLLMASVDGALAACGMSTRSSVEGAAFVGIWVRPEQRRRGAGTALLAALTAHARELGLVSQRARVRGRQEAGLAFLAHHGFEDSSTDVEARLDLSAGGPPPAAPPEGVEIVSLASRPDLGPEVYQLALEGFRELPVVGPSVVVPYDTWQAEHIGQALPGGSFLAVAGGRLIGWAGLEARPGDATGAEHGLTVVAREWRRRGVGGALKRAQIDWARRSGYRMLVTYTDDGNEPILRLNEGLGYRPWIIETTCFRPLDGHGS